MKNRRLAEISKKLGVNVEQVRDIIVQHHELEQLISKRDLRKIKFNMGLDSAKLVARVAKTLKVSEDAVVNSLLVKYLDEQEKQNEQSRKSKK